MRTPAAQTSPLRTSPFRRRVIRTTSTLALTGVAGLTLPAALSGAAVSAPTGSSPVVNSGVALTANPATANPAMADLFTARSDRTKRKIGQVKPVIIAHRGASGYRPEHTAAAYELAVQMGADYIEPDLVMTKDGVLVDRHEPEISTTTDVADHPEFAARKTTKTVDGAPMTGWFTEDFTLAELKTLRAKERLPQLRQHNTLYDGRYQVLTYAEDLKLRAELSKKYGREIGIIPEIKHSTYFHALGFNPEKETARLTRKFGLDKRKAPMWIQSFELNNLKVLRQKYKMKAHLVFLADSEGAPYDTIAAGHPRSYDELMTPAGLKEIATFADAVAPYKDRIIPRDAAGNLLTPTSLVADAHAAGLQVTSWTFRAENNWLPTNLKVGSNPADFGKAIDEDLAFMRAGLDNMFCDQPDVCLEARKIFTARS